MLRRVRDLLVPRIDSSVGEELSRVVWTGLTVIVVGVLGFGGWAAFAPLSGAVIAPGFVKVDMNRKVVQHQEGGIVKQIFVRDGDHVGAGQTVMLLEDVKVDASLELLRTQLDAERAKVARLEAERVVAPGPKFPADLEARAKEVRVAELIERETALFRARRQSLESQMAVINKQIRETRDEIKAWREQIAAEERAIKLMREELAANESLLKQGFVANTRILGLQRQVAEYEARYGEHQAELAKAHQRISELELRTLSMRNDYVKAATDELKESTSRMFDIDERLRPTKDASDRQKIVAPIAGEVVGLKFFTSGGIVGPREVLMEIVPDERTLIVEARLRPEDINHVRPGAHADVRLTAYKPRNTPMVEGSVTYVSGDRLMDTSTPGGTPYYLVYVNVPTKALADAGNLKMSAGMPAEVYIRTDQRTAADYLLAPVTAYFRRGLREPL